MNRRKLSAGLVAGAMALMGLGVSTAHAGGPTPAVDPAPTTYTLPLLVPITVSVTTGPGGNIADVSVDPATTDITQQQARPNKVRFENNADGVRVTIKSKGQSQSLTAKGGSLADFTNGPGGWSGDVFGDGVICTVSFLVGGTDAAPTLVVDPVAAPCTGEVIPPETSMGDDDDEDEVTVRSGVVFTSADGSMTRTLSIKVKTESGSESDDGDDDESDSSAQLKISLGKIRGVAQDPAAVVGITKTWNGLLCDGTPASISYMVNADGSITVSGTTPTTADVKTEGGKADVRFSKSERVKIKARTNDAGQITVNIDEKIRCRGAADPTFNGDPSTAPSGGDHHDGDKKGDDDGGHHGGDGGDHQDD